MTGIFDSAGSRAARVQRLLIPIRQRSERSLVHRLEARLVERLKRQGPLSVTLLNVCAPGEGAEGARFLERISATFPSVGLTRLVIEGTDPASTILAEAARGYQLLVLGGTEGIELQAATFHPLIDELVRLAPCPTIVVRGGTTVGHWPPRRLLVPANGSIASREAAELAFLLATREDEEVVVLGTPATSARSAGSASELIALGRKRGVRARGAVEISAGPDAETAILEAARREAADMIMLGTDLYRSAGSHILRPRVELILQRSPCPVILVNGSAAGSLLAPAVLAGEATGLAGEATGHLN
jgi:nucleotide-binding universal stress UspA family protein